MKKYNLLPVKLQTSFRRPGSFKDGVTSSARSVMKTRLSRGGRKGLYHTHHHKHMGVYHTHRHYHPFGSYSHSHQHYKGY